jgi:hypothetical protein
MVEARLGSVNLVAAQITIAVEYYSSLASRLEPLVEKMLWLRHALMVPKSDAVSKMNTFSTLDDLGTAHSKASRQRQAQSKYMV